jgi:hypothetical protein
MKEARFFCEHCGKEVKSSARVCTHCGSFFSAVRCPKCSFSGAGELFLHGCPRCGYAGGTVDSEQQETAFEFSLGSRNKRTAPAGLQLPPWFFLVAIVVLGLSFLVLVFIYLNL